MWWRKKATAPSATPKAPDLTVNLAWQDDNGFTQCSAEYGLARHLWRAFSILRCPPFELKRADEVERRMAADGIVEAVDVTADCARGFDPALEEGAPDEFGLEGLEERLDHGVVEAVSLARHRDRDAVLSQLSLVLDGAVLAATVRVVNEPGGWTPHGDGPA